MPQRLGYLLFAFGWAYALGQLPSGGLLDRFGSKRVYGIAIIGWSICAFLTGLCRLPRRQRRLHRDLHSESAFRPFPVARLPRQRPHRRLLVSHYRARTRLRHLQLRAIFRAAHLCAHLRMAAFTGPAGRAASGSWARSAAFSLSSGSPISTASRIIRASRRPRSNSSSAAAAWSIPTPQLARRKHAHLGHGQKAAQPSHAGWRLHRPVLHHHAHLVFSHVVSALPFAGAAHVGPQGRICGRRAGPLRRLRRNPRRRHLRQASRIAATRSASRASFPSWPAWRFR